MKLIGSLLVIVATTLMGAYYSNQYKMRIKSLLEMYRMLQMLSGEIEFSRGVLGESFLRLGNRVAKEYQVFLQQLSYRLAEGNGQTLEENWKQAVEEHLHITYLTKEDYDLFISLGEQLGYLDYEMELKTISMYMDRLQLKISNLEKEMTTKCKLYHTLGIASGCLFVLFII